MVLPKFPIGIGTENVFGSLLIQRKRLRALSPLTIVSIAER